jgi:hypothetical protein
MATVRIFTVSFTPAERLEDGFSTVLDMGRTAKRHDIAAASLPDLERQVRELAAAFGQTCIPWIVMKGRDDRKPPGFDRWADTMRIIDYVPPIAAAA